MPSHDLCGAAKNKLFGTKGGAENLGGGRARRHYYYVRVLWKDGKDKAICF